MGRLPLKGVRIVDLSIVWAGPHCTRLLADMGAEVIKVESRGWFDPIRGPARPRNPGDGCYPANEPGERPYNRHGYFNERNRNKLGVCLDLRHELGKAAFKRLVAASDVVVENFSAGVMDRLGLGYDQLRRVRPDLIMLSMPSFGCTGPESHYVGYGATNDQLSGLVSVTGYGEGEPENIGINASDPIAGQHAAAAVLAALVHRRRSGRGQFVDLSHRESAARLMAGPVIDYFLNSRVAAPRGNRHASAAPHGCYPCAPRLREEDGVTKRDERWVALSVETDGQWAALCQAMGRPDLARDPRFTDVVSRWRNQEQMDPLIAAWMAPREPADVMVTLQSKGIAAGVLHSGETLLADPQLRSLGFWAPITHPEAGTHDYMGVAWRLSATPGAIRSPAPCLGQHTEQILRDIAGLSKAEIDRLVSEGVAGEGAALPDPP
ncbi:MAG: CoA transferase [Chloroflexi bacterium]|nr:CoA transferase [Chloroflexota bacterium]